MRAKDAKKTTLKVTHATKTKLRAENTIKLAKKDMGSKG